MNEIVLGLISLLGTAIGTIGGVLMSNKLTSYRIDQLEKRVDKATEKLDKTNEKVVIIEQSTKSAHHRIDSIEDKLKSIKEAAV